MTYEPFKKLNQWLLEREHGQLVQVDGPQVAQFELNGRTFEYKEILVTNLCRNAEEDLAIVRADVERKFCDKISDVLANNNGPIYWRIRPEWNECPVFDAAQWKEILPGWVSVGAYCRLVRLPEMEKV